MGLEIVELFMRVEEEFAIEIFDEEASALETVGQLHLCVLSKLGLLNAGRCRSSATFYQTRRALMEISGAPRRSIAPATPVVALLPAQNRHREWRQLAELTGAVLPPLQRPRWMTQLLGCAALSMLALWAIALFVAPNVIWLIALTSMSLLLLGGASRWSERYATQLPASCATVGAAVQTMLRVNHGMNVQKRDERSAEQVWDKLCEIMVDELGVSSEAITKDAQFVRDLGLG